MEGGHVPNFCSCCPGLINLVPSLGDQVMFFKHEPGVTSAPLSAKQPVTLRGPMLAEVYSTQHPPTLVPGWNCCQGPAIRLAKCGSVHLKASKPGLYTTHIPKWGPNDGVGIEGVILAASEHQEEKLVCRSSRSRSQEPTAGKPEERSEE